MDAYVAVVSHHGRPEQVYLFDTEDEARRFARELSEAEGWDNLAEEHIHDPDHDDADHSHENDWLEDWGDDDGCGVVAGLAASPEAAAGG